MPCKWPAGPLSFRIHRAQLPLNKKCRQGEGIAAADVTSLASPLSVTQPASSGRELPGPMKFNIDWMAFRMLLQAGNL